MAIKKLPMIQKISPWVWGGLGVVVVAFGIFGRKRKETIYRGALGVSPSGRPWPKLIGIDGKPMYGTKATWKTFDVAPKNRKYVEMARKIARKHGIPEEGLMYQYWYESRYNPDIESKVGAQGVGQLMPKAAISQGVMTGVTSGQRKEYNRQYDAGKALEAKGVRLYPKAHKNDPPHPERKRMRKEGRKMRLEASRWLSKQPGVVDRRSDPQASIEAGAKIMKKLYKEYGNWAIATGAYNWGPGNMNRALRNKSHAHKNVQRYMLAVGPYYHSEPKDFLVQSKYQAQYRPWPTVKTSA